MRPERETSCYEEHRHDFATIFRWLVHQDPNGTELGTELRAVVAIVILWIAIVKRTYGTICCKPSQ